MSEIIEGIKLIYHNAGGITEPDDVSYPYCLKVSLRHPDFMGIASLFLLGGSEQITVLGKEQEQLERFLDLNNLRHHVRLIQWEIHRRPSHIFPPA